MHNTIHFICNDESIQTASAREIVALDFLRKEKRLTGTKEGCREGDCGACTVLLGELINDKVYYKTVNSCLLPLHAIAGKHLVTIEGLNLKGLSPIQQMIVDEGGSQCGFCTPGFIVSLTGFLLSSNELCVERAIEYISGNICRCTGYESIKRAVKTLVEKAAEVSADTHGQLRITKLAEAGFIPEYFATICERLEEIFDISLPVENPEESRYIVSGGTDLYVQKWEDIVTNGSSFLAHDTKSKRIEIIKDECFIGAGATISEVMNSTLLKHTLPDLQKDLKYFGSMQIRNRGTVGGNIINASPIGDLTNILLALNAKLHLVKEGYKREVLLRNFYKGYKTLDKDKDELLEEVSFKLPSMNAFFSYEKVARRTYLDIASVNSSILIEHNNYVIYNINISAGGVAPYPLYLSKTAEYFHGKELTNSVIKTGIEIALSEISPISDARGSAEYKTILFRQLLLAHFIKFSHELISVEAYK